LEYDCIINILIFAANYFDVELAFSC